MWSMDGTRCALTRVRVAEGDHVLDLLAKGQGGGGGAGGGQGGGEERSEEHGGVRGAGARSPPQNLWRLGRHRGRDRADDYGA
jgi:hypothetical protein